MEFSSLSFGVTTGNFGALVSRDGGLTWAPSPEGMAAFSFADDLTGLGVAATGLYRTTDGGETFTLVAAGVADAVAFLSSTVAVAIVDDSLLRSTDGGVTWTAGARGRGAEPGSCRLRRCRAGLGTKRVPIPTTTTASSARATVARPGPTSAR